MDDYRSAIWLSNVNTMLGSLLLGACALAAGLVIWQAAFGTNPFERVLLSSIYQVDVK